MIILTKNIKENVNLTLRHLGLGRRERRNYDQVNYLPLAWLTNT